MLLWSCAAKCKIMQQACRAVVEGAELLWDDVEGAEYTLDKHRVGVPATSSLKHSHQDVPDPAVHCVSSSCGSLNIQLKWNHFHIGCT